MAAGPAPQLQRKNVVVCCDGTGNQFGTHNTNVIRLFQVIEKNTDTQMAYYDPGVGTFGSRYQALIGLATGYGITRNIKDAYEYLMNRYEDGDHVYLFGFSRGAYTARALAGMLYKCGLLQKGSINLMDYAVDIYKTRDNHDVARQFKETYCRECPVHFIGVWDTVKALIPFSQIARFTDHRLNPQVKFGYHALAIDERRDPYKPELWDETDLPAHQTIEQVWFAGVHSDVGGSYLDPGLADVTLKWMLENAQARGLLVKQEELAEIIPNPYGKLHDSRDGLWNLLPGGPRKIPAGVKVHASAFARKENPKSAYNPPNWPQNAQKVS